MLGACEAPEDGAEGAPAPVTPVRGVADGEAQPPVADAATPTPDLSVPRPDSEVEPDASVPDAFEVTPDAVAPPPDAARPDPDPTPDAAAPPMGEPEFVRHTVDAMSAGPAYVEPVDWDGDGHLDLLVAELGVFSGFAVPEGAITLYRGTGDLGRWEKSALIPPEAGVHFPGQPTAVDVDGDGDLDLLVPSGFLVCQVIPGGQPCGGLAWYERMDDGALRRRDVVPLGSSLFYHHAVLVDLDGDGRDDLVTVGEEKQAGFGETPERAVAQWFAGVDGPARFDPEPRTIGRGLGSFPRVIDLDGDGDLDVASAEFFDSDASFAWYEQTDDGFVRHAIDDVSGPAVMLSFVEDLYGDGVLRAVGTNHTNTQKFPPDEAESAVFVFDIPEDPRGPWPRRQVSQGIVSAVNLFAPQAAPGIFGHGDIDRDGDIDLLVCGDGDPRVFWLEQVRPGTFESHVLEQQLPQSGGAKVVDLDGDGAPELVVTGYESNAVYVYEVTLR